MWDMAIQKKGIKKNVLMKFNNIQANNWDIDCDANSLNDYSDDYEELEKPKLQNFKEELEQEEKEEQSKKDSTDFYKVIEELKKKNKKDKPLSYGNNSGNSYILNNR